MSEHVLIQIARGDARAVEACMATYGPLVWSLARRYLRNVQDAEDAVQEIFVGLWKSAESFDPEKGSERTFIMTLARRRLIDRLRRMGRSLKATDLDSAPEPAGETVPDRVEIDDEKRRVLGALDQLRPAQQEVLRLALLEGQTHQQIAQQTGMPMGTVKSHARRGLIRIRELLDGGGDDGR